MSRLLDLTGQRFERWLVIRRAEGRYWQCKCDCGTVRNVQRNALKRRTSKSCGCWANELLSKRSRRHGMHRSRTHLAWVGLKQRCGKEVAYKDIGYDPKWEKFEHFLEDMGVCPAGYSIERIDVYGNYCKNNCMWIPMKDQALNKRNTIKITVDNVTLPAVVWCRKLNLNYNTVMNRLITLKWPPLQALELEPRTQT